MTRRKPRLLWFLDFTVAITAVWAFAAFALDWEAGGGLVAVLALLAGWLVLFVMVMRHLKLKLDEVGCVSATVIAPATLLALVLLMLFDFTIFGWVRRGQPPPRPMFHNHLRHGRVWSDQPIWESHERWLDSGHLWLADHDDNIVVIVLSASRLLGRESERILAGMRSTTIPGLDDRAGQSLPALTIDRTPDRLHILTLGNVERVFVLQPGAARRLDVLLSEDERRDDDDPWRNLSLRDLRDYLEPDQQAAFDDWLTTLQRP
jgi:hypothetical protein